MCLSVCMPVSLRVEVSLCVCVCCASVWASVSVCPCVCVYLSSSVCIMLQLETLRLILSMCCGPVTQDAVTQLLPMSLFIPALCLHTEE